MECPPRPRLPLLPLALASVLVENTSISQDARIIGSSRVHRRPVSIAASPAGSPPNTSSRISGGRSDTVTPPFARSSRAPSPPVTKFQGAMPTTGACALSAARSATGTRASAAALLRYGTIQATGACASAATPLSVGTGACAPGAAPPQATRRAVVRLLRLHVGPCSEDVLLLHRPDMRWRSI